ncbi:MAG: prolipoprotein diacylglyceryl transferase family protein [Phycisphaerales bacterium]
MIGRALYAIVFVVALPIALAAWARRLDELVQLPLPASAPLGVALATIGVGLTLVSMLALWRHGDGLPMNAYPPRRLVRVGPYAILAHPIYIGFVVACAGASIAYGSPAGFWIVTPAAALGCAALVLGFERDDLRRRFGPAPFRPLIALPRDGSGRPSSRDVVGVWLALFLPWCVGYELLGHLPVHDAHDVMAGRESQWPVWPITAVLYSSAYPGVVLAPWFARSAASLRRWCLDAWFGIAVGFLCFLVVPIVATPRPYDAASPFAWLLELERSDGVGARAAFPSFHAFWAFMAAILFRQRGRGSAVGGTAWAIAVAASCITTGMHATIDVVAGATLAVVAVRREHLWRAARAGAEHIANSWREWRIGPVRVISHGAWAGLAAFAGLVIAGCLLDARETLILGGVSFVSLAGAALWGQYWVGSRTLLRPFGYFGSVLGVGVALIALAVVAPSALDVARLAAALAVAAPFVQAIGRLRCLIQGCCHGRPIDPGCGITYRHPRSRVVTIAKLVGVEVHATPLYSIVGNLVIGALLARLWSVGAPLTMVTGAYLYLAGCSRFVEESLRGEPQTQIYAGLRVYQWCAIASAVAGIAVTCVPSAEATGAHAPGAAAIATAFVVGLAHWFAMGVDFPETNRRFGRLV